MGAGSHRPPALWEAKIPVTDPLHRFFIAYILLCIIYFKGITCQGLNP